MNGRKTRFGLPALAALLAVSLFAMGCYSTTIRSGKPPGQSPVEHTDKWHHGFIWGIAEASGPYDVNRICPGGWAEIHTETGFLAGFVSWLTDWFVYTPQNTSVRCASGAPVP